MSMQNGETSSEESSSEDESSDEGSISLEKNKQSFNILLVLFCIVTLNF